MKLFCNPLAVIQIHLPSAYKMIQEILLLIHIGPFSVPLIAILHPDWSREPLSPPPLPFTFPSPLSSILKKSVTRHHTLKPPCT